MGIKIVGCNDVSIHDGNELLTVAGEPFRVFTPYAKAWARLKKPSTTNRVRRIEPAEGVFSLPLPDLGTWGLASETHVPEAGEKAARRRMKMFLEKGLADYQVGRNLLGKLNFPALAGSAVWPALDSRAAPEMRGAFQRAIRGRPEERREIYQRACLAGVLSEHSLALSGGARSRIRAEVAWNEMARETRITSGSGVPGKPGCPSLMPRSANLMKLVICRIARA